ncbi:MAG: triple tyrosine motif-containing protein [Flavobacteriaceae bacterium]|nr:triple tyrosine motif-containing protein [Flavobacteriaceae bacterium]
MSFLRLWLLAVYLLSIDSSSQELPPIINYPADVYRANNQNWMISQGPQGFIYAANNDGLLEFNGASWQLYPTPNQSIMRSVCAIGPSIYTGFYMDFGYWSPTAQGTLVYTSMMDELGIKPLEDEQFWRILPYDKWLVVQSLSRILLIDTNTKEITYVSAQNTLSKVFLIGDELYFQDISVGLFTIKNGQKKRINDSSLAKEVRIIGACILDNNPTFISETNGIYLLQKDKLVPWRSDINESLKNEALYSALQRRNGDLVLGTISDGLIYVSTTKGLIEYHLNRSNGLGNNTVLSLFEDEQLNIWTGLDNGISCVNTASAVRLFVEQQGALGTTYASAIHDEHIYLGSNQGLFYKPKDGLGKFQLISGTEGQVWSLNSINGTLFCGHNSGTFVIEQNRAVKISSIPGAWDVQPIPGQAMKVLQGNYDGLYVLRYDEQVNQWAMAHKINGFNYSAKDFEITENHQVVVSHEYKGVYLLNLDEPLNNVVDYALIPELAKGLHSDLETFDGHIYYAAQQGVYSSATAPIAFSRDSTLSALFDSNQYSTGTMVADDYDRLWFLTLSGLTHVAKDPIDNSYVITGIPLPQALRNDMTGQENLAFLDKEHLLYGNASGYLRLRTDLSLDELPHQLKLTSVAAQDNLTNEIKLMLDGGGQLSHEQNNLAFSYNISDYNLFTSTLYQHRITPFNPQWSQWSTQSTFAIKNLTPGNYTFEARAKRNGQILPSQIAYTFTISPPWYQSTAARLVYILCFVLSLILSNYLYRSYYQRQRDRILKTRTAELELRELANQKEIMALRNQQLKQDIESRNRELAISTMNMINKTSTLNKLKQEMSQLTPNEELKKIVKSIDKAINDGEDWAFFEQAFNHADKKFFTRLKERHPVLTPNDLKLCVYLRLNLSSKEIAPLLNISSRSVEIKRYRLRKKLDLERDTNLNEYVISI